MRRETSGRPSTTRCTRWASKLIDFRMPLRRALRKCIRTATLADVTDSVRAILELGRVARARLDPAARFLFGSAALATIVLAGFIARRGTLETRLLAALVVGSVAVGYVARWLLWRRALRRRDRLVQRVVVGADRELGERVLRALALDEQARRDATV